MKFNNTGVILRFNIKDVTGENIVEKIGEKESWWQSYQISSNT